MITLVNGQPSETVSIHDRGLAYGDGVFETMLSNNGQIRLWSKHLARLTRSLQQLKIEPFDPDPIFDIFSPYLATTQQQIIKLTVTRGQGPRGYAPSSSCKPTSIITIDDRKAVNPTFWQQGVKVCICKTRVARQHALAGLKHLNRLEQVLASLEIVDTEFNEGLMLDEHNNVISGTRHNIFMVKDGVLLTPDLSACGVAGVMREHILEVAASAEIPVRVNTLNLDQINHADELFLTNSVNGIWPICQLQGTMIDKGRITSELQSRIAGVVMNCE